MKALELLQIIYKDCKEWEDKGFAVTYPTDNLSEAIKELEDLQNKDNELIKEVLFEADLETNFNGYPLENPLYYSDDIRKCLCENEFKRFHKNKNYKLKLIIEEYN